MYRGLASVAHALRVANDPQAEAIRARAEQYREDIRTDWRAAIAQCPKQTLADSSRL